jgi:5-methylthioadenosine/S-adenosylhomocysteine deaminase
VLGQTIIQFAVADAKTPADELTRTEAFIKAWRNDDLVVPAVAPHAMYTLDEASLKASRALADRYGVPVLIHLAETRGEVDASRKDHGLSPTEYLESLGFWGPRTLAAHTVWMSDEDIAILARRGVGASHNPESNMKLASGTAPVLKLRAAGVATGLGTDGAASNNDLTCSRHAAGGVPAQAVVGRSAGARRGGGVDMATREGARAGDGSVDRSWSGKRADHRRGDGRGPPGSDVRSGVASRVRHARGRRANDDREWTGADARPAGPDPRCRAGHRRGARLGGEGQGGRRFVALTLALEGARDLIMQVMLSREQIDKRIRELALNRAGLRPTRESTSWAC